MITKNECLTLLMRLEGQGVNIDAHMRAVLLAKNPPVETLKFIAKNKGFEAAEFYEMLRKKTNQKKSPLYKNILRGVTTIQESITTLTCLLTQIVLYSSKLEDPGVASRFLQGARAGEIANALKEYFEVQNPELCLNLLKLINADIKVLEFLRGQRELSAE